MNNHLDMKLIGRELYMKIYDEKIINNMGWWGIYDTDRVEKKEDYHGLTLKTDSYLDMFGLFKIFEYIYVTSSDEDLEDAISCFEWCFNSIFEHKEEHDEYFDFIDYINDELEDEFDDFCDNENCQDY